MPSIVSTIVEVAVFRFVGSTPEYLILRRSRSEQLYPLLWQIISGSLEGGETATAAALRELREETGFTPEHFWVVPHTNTFLDAVHDVMQITSVFLAQVKPAAEPVLSAEHEEYVWCPLKRAQSLLVWPGQLQALKIVDEFIVRGLEAAALSEMQIPRR